MKWRRAGRARAQLEITLPASPSGRAIKLTTRISGSATFSLDGMTSAQRLVSGITGRTDIVIRDSADIERLPDRCLEDFCRHLPLDPVWPAYKALCSLASECSASYGPDDLPEPLRDLMRLVAQYAYRLSRFPKSQRIASCLQSKDPRALDEIEQRLREIIGAPVTAEELLTADQAVLRRAESELFLEHLGLTAC